MNLDPEQKAKVSAWIAEGLKLAEIQKKLSTDFGITCTYMEVRFLVDDLKLIPKDVELPKPPESLPAPPVAESKPAAAAMPAPPPPPAGPPAAPGQLSLKLDEITRPGAIVSGKVTFSDGQEAEWYLDQMGRLGLTPKQAGYRPSQTDVQEFQVRLQNELAKLGF